MKTEQLAEIVMSAHKKKIAKQLKALDYIDCAKQPEMREISRADIENADRTYTEKYRDKKGKKIYVGCTVKHVRGWEQYEFAEITEYRADRSDGNGSETVVSFALFAKEIEM